MQLSKTNDENDTTNECCNSGCNNCVLDIRQRKLEQQRRNRKLNDSSCINVFSGGSYATFQVKSIVPLTANVLRFCFQYRIDGDNDGKIADDGENQQQQRQHSATTSASSSYYLCIPPTFYLLLRAPISESPSAPSTTVSQWLDKRERHDKNTADHFISRPYTPCVYDSEALTFDILVKLQTNGCMSGYLRELHIGQCTEWKGCFGSFEWAPNKYKYLICISQGVAIAPIHHLATSILADESDDTIIYSLACYQNIDNILLRDEHSQFRQYWNFHSRIYLSESQCNCRDQTELRESTVTCARINDAVRDVQQQESERNNCQCLKKQQRFNENICNYRLDSQELINLYRKLNTSSIRTVFCGVEKLEKVIQDCLHAIDDSTISENYIKLE